MLYSSKNIAFSAIALLSQQEPDLKESNNECKKYLPACIATLALAFVVSTTSVFAACSTPEMLTGPPTSFEFSTNSYFIGKETIKWDADQKVLTRTSTKGFNSAAVSTSLQITDAQWAALWQKINDANGWTWNGAYNHPEIEDGLAWTIAIQNGECSIQATGSNGYPPGNVTSLSKEWQAIYDFVFSLIPIPEIPQPPTTPPTIPPTQSSIGIEKPAKDFIQKKAGVLMGTVAGLSESQDARIELSITRPKKDKKKKFRTCEALNKDGKFIKVKNTSTTQCAPAYLLVPKLSSDRKAWSFAVKRKLAASCYKVDARLTVTSKLGDMAAQIKETSTSFCIQRHSRL